MKEMMDMRRIYSYLNTSHVILYLQWIITDQLSLLFKYISCYSLSYWYPHVLYGVDHLNTSHVILYQVIDEKNMAACAFKYISCYSLSNDYAANSVHRFI